MKRRLFLQSLTGAACAAVLLSSGLAFAGSYLERSAVLLQGAEVEGKRMRRRFHDKELAKLLHGLAETRVSGAGQMQVPKEVERAHPHLLLSIEQYERALHAAMIGEHTKFLLALDKARREATTFRAILQKSGWTLPVL